MVSVEFGILLLIVIVPTLDLSYGEKIEKVNNEDFTRYWVTKFKKHFDALDVNQDGNVTEEEHIGATTERAKRVLPSWRAKAVYGVMTMAYHTWWSNEYSDYKTSISFEDLVQSLKKDIDLTSNQLVETALDFFHIVDIDCSEKLTLNEYSKFLDIFRNTADNEVIFNVTDRDGDTIIDAKEFTYGMNHFIYDQVADSSTYFFGSRD